MTDLEDRLRSTLDGEAGTVLDVRGLAGAARSRRGRRRRVRLATAALALAVVVPGATVVARALTPSDDGVAGSATAGRDPAAWRTVSWHGVSISVPATWRDGQPSNWCVGHGTPAAAGAVVATPALAPTVLDIVCNPDTGYGIEVGPTTGTDAGHLPGGWSWTFETWDSPPGPDGERPFPTGATVAIAVDGDVRVRIVAPERALAEAIARTVRRTTPAAGWRTIRWSGGEADVPSSWTEGGPSAWCVDARRPEDAGPAYELPTTVVPAIGCGRPGTGYGLIVGATTDTPVEPAHEYRWVGREARLRSYPDGSWVQTVRLGSYAVTVVTADQSTTETIAGSLRKPG